MKNLISQEEYDQALARGRAEMLQPHAVEARFVIRGALLHVKFSNGLSLVLDARTVPALKGHPLSSLKNPYVTVGGDGIVFEDANLSFNLPNLLAPYLPLDLARSRVAAESGKASSIKKAHAARANGLKGGRPRKVVLVTA